MSIQLAQKNLEQLLAQIDREIVNDHFHQGIITVKKEPFEEYLVEKLGTMVQQEFEFEGEYGSLLDYWWLEFKRRVKKGPRSNAKFETDVIDKNGTVLVQYCAVNKLPQGKTQDNVAEYVKRHLRGAAKKTNQAIHRQLLNAHAAAGGGEVNFPTDPQMPQAEVDAHVKAGYRKRNRLQQSHKDKSDKIMERGGEGASGTVGSQKIKLAIKQWEAVLDDVQGMLAKNLIKSQIWTVKGWFRKYFGMETKFQGDWTTRKIEAGLLVQHTILPDNKLNSGTLDESVIRMFMRELDNGNVYLKAFAWLYKKLPMTKVLDFWANSPAPIDKVSALVKKRVIDDLFPHKTTPNMKLKVNKKLYKDGKRLKTNKTKTKNPSKKLQQAIIGGNVYKAKKRRKKTAQQRGQGRTPTSPIALRNILNEALPAMVASKMVQPALQFRTGRFANSARIENLTIGSRGGIQVDYDYMKQPYQTFEPGFKQGSTQRDPRKIIGESIRELAMGIIGRAPYSIRRA
tara:strand:+ start:245 stop:1777 length:1533 start_codon:yes stop_codon:yes gene_type:complete